jgi:hypothetical protein
MTVKLLLDVEPLKEWIDANAPNGADKLAAKARSLGGKITGHGIRLIKRTRHIPRQKNLIALAGALGRDADTLIVPVKTKRKHA